MASIWDLIDKYPNKYWDWTNLSRDPSTTFENVRTYINKPWSWPALSERLDLTQAYILDKDFIDRWDGFYLSANPIVTEKFVDDNPLFHFDYRGLSRNLSISINYILANLNNMWDWCAISCRNDLSQAIVDANPNLPWFYDCLTTNPSMK